MRTKGLLTLHARVDSKLKFGLLGQESVGDMPLSMALSCLRYLRCGEVIESCERWKAENDPFNISESLPQSSQLARSMTFFAFYAILHWKSHLQASEREGCSPSLILRSLMDIKSTDWLKLPTFKRIHGQYASGYPRTYASYFHAICANGLENTLETVFTSTKRGNKSPKAPNLDKLINMPDRDEFTPLMLATLSGSDRIVNCLISNGADVNNVNVFGLNALCIAVQGGHKKVVEALIYSEKCDRNLASLQTPGRRCSYRFVI